MPSRQLFNISFQRVTYTVEVVSLRTRYIKTRPQTLPLFVGCNCFQRKEALVSLIL